MNLEDLIPIGSRIKVAPFGKTTSPWSHEYSEGIVTRIEVCRGPHRLGDWDGGEAMNCGWYEEFPTTPAIYVVYLPDPPCNLACRLHGVHFYGEHDPRPEGLRIVNMERNEDAEV